MSRSQLRIGEVAQLLGVTPKTVRHYHRRGLIPEPPRSESDYRLYTAADLLRLRHIRQLQAMGLSLAQIKTVFDAADPDAKLQTVLTRLRADLQAEYERIAGRIRRVEDYLAQEASLSEVVRPESPSPTYAALVGALPSELSMSEAMVAFDQRLFAELDSFQWGDSYAKVWQRVAEMLTHDPSLQTFMLMMAGRIEAAAELSPDAPEIEQWAREAAQSVVIQDMGEAFMALSPISSPHGEAMSDLIHTTSAAQFTPAQQRLFSLFASYVEGK